MSAPLNAYDRHQEAMYRAQMKVIEQYYVSYYRTKLKQGEIPDSVFMEGEFLKIRKFVDTPRTVENSATIMITINPPDDSVDWTVLHKIVELIASYQNFLTDVRYSLEQRSEDPSNPYGWHTHMIAVSAKPRSDIIKRCYAAYKKVTNTDPGMQVIDYKSNRPLSYIQKDKKCDAELGGGYQGRVF